MANLGSLFYSLNIKDYTDADLKRINAKLQNLGYDITLTPKILKEVTQANVPKGVKIELDPQITNEALKKASEGKLFPVEIRPLLTSLRKAIRDFTKEQPTEVDIAPNAAKLRTLVEKVLNQHGYMVNISTVNDNYTKVVQQKLNGTRYTVKIHADAKEITQSVQTSLMQIQSRYFGLRVSRDILYRSIDEALGTHQFPIRIKVLTDQARSAVQSALQNGAGLTGKDALSFAKAESLQAAAALNRVKTAHLEAAGAAKAHATASVDLGSAMGRNITIAGELGGAMASLYSVHAAKQFLAQVVEIGGELEHQKIAMDTIFGDKGKTTELFGQIKGLARQSPFGVMELTKSVKALSAYGVEYNEIYDTAKRLADISAATSVDINRLILAFGKTRSRGFLDGLEAKQFAYANIPIYEMVRKKLEELEGQAVTTAEVMARMKKREIGFDIVKDVLWDMTDEGGKFYNMQEALAESVKTSWKLVRDNIELMMGEIAESFVGDWLKDSAQILQALTRNWKTLGTAIAAVAVAYGIQRAVVMSSNTMLGQYVQTSIKSIQTENARQVQLAKTASIYRKLTYAEADALGAQSALNKVVKSSIFARKRLSKVELESLYASNALTRDSLLRLAATGRLEKGTLGLMRQTNLLTYADMRYLAQLRQSTTFLGIQGKTAAALAMRFKLLGASIQAVSKSMVALLTNPWTIAMAAVGGIAYLWQRNSEETRKAKEIGDDLFTSATEGAKNLKQVLSTIGDDIANLSGQNLKDAIDNLESAIKDYSPTPDKALRDAKTGYGYKVKGSQEYAQALKDEAEALKTAAEWEEDHNIAAMYSNAMSAADSGWFDDDLNTDLKDYEKAYADANKRITKYLADYRINAAELVKIAESNDPAYRQQASELQTLAEKFELLAKKSGDFSAAWNAIHREVVEDGVYKQGYKGLYDIQLDWVNTDSRVPEAKAAVEEELNQVITYLKGEFEKAGVEFEKGVKPERHIQIVLEKIANKMFEEVKGLPADAQDALRSIWNEAFDLPFDDTAIYGSITKYASEHIDELGSELAKKLREGTPFLELTSAEQDAVKALIDDATSNVKKRMPHLTKEIEKALKEPGFEAKVVLSLARYSDLDEWKQELIKKAGGNPIIIADLKSAPDIASVQDAVRKSYKAAQAEMTKLKGIKLPVGYEFKMGKKVELSLLERQQLPAYIVKAIDDWNKSVDVISSADAFGKELGFDPAKDPTKSDKKDKVAESFKQRFKDIKDAWSEMQKWQKSIGTEAATDKIAESGLFSTLNKDAIPRTAEEYKNLIEQLEAELRAAGIKGHSQRESLLNEMIKLLFDVDRTELDKDMKAALDKATKEAERQLADWNLYEKIRKATGNKDLAMSVAFGMNANAETDYPTLIKKQFDDAYRAAQDANKNLTDATFDTLTEEQVKALPDELQKAWESATSKLAQYAKEQKESLTEILSSYQSTQDKIRAIDVKRDEEKQKVQASTMSDADKAVVTRRIDVQADYEKFKQGADYLQFFSGIYSLTLQQAEAIGDKIKLNLSDRLQAGTISAKEYYDEISKVNQQLSKLRNVKSDSMTFLTSGVSGLNKKKLDQADSSVLEQMRKVEEAQEKLEAAKKSGSEFQMKVAEVGLQMAEKELKKRIAIRDAIVKDMEAWQNVLDVVNIASNIANGISDAFNSIKDMASSFGVDVDSGAWADIQGAIETFTSVTSGLQQVIKGAMSGDVGGMLSGVVSTITTPFTIWNKLHDKKLQKEIENEQELYDRRQQLIDKIESRIERFLGSGKNAKIAEAEEESRRFRNNAARVKALKSGAAINYPGELQRLLAEQISLAGGVAAYESGGAYGYERYQMERQLSSLERQRAAEADKKDSDDSAIAEYDSQIAEMREKIKYFAEDTAKTLYGIDFKDWASQLGDAIFEAWKKGEDGAEAFKETAASIMGDVMNSMLKLAILEPMMENLRLMLFGKNGKSGYFGEDFELQEDEIQAIAGEIMKGTDKVSEYQKALDQLEAYMQANYGVSLKDTSDKGGLSAGIQSITEDTADLLASYVNSIRAFVAQIAEGQIEVGENIRQIALEALPKLNALAASQLRVQEKIAENTLANAKAAQEIYNLLRKNINGGNKFNI